MKNIIKLAVAAIAAVALTQTVNAVPISGNIGFTGTAVLSPSDAGTATSVTFIPGSTTVAGHTGAPSESGTFATFGGGIPFATLVTMYAPTWAINNHALSPLNNFWSVNGFTFTLTSWTVAQTPGILGSLTLNLFGTVSGNSFDATSFIGAITLQNPSSNGADQFTASMSFGSVPDGGTTVLLLGAALSGLALVKRKFMA